MNLKQSLRASLLAVAGLLAACGSGGDDGTCLTDIGICDGGGTGSGGTGGVSADKVRLTVLGPLNEDSGQRFTSGQLTVAPSSRTVGFVARLEDIRNVNSPRRLSGYSVNLDVLMGSDTYGRARAVVISSDGICPSSGGARGGVTNADGDLAFCFTAPPTSEVEVGDELVLTARATAFVPTTAGSTTTTAVRALFSLFVSNPSNNYRLVIAGPGGEPTETLTVGSGATLSGFTATISSDDGSLPTPRPFVRLVPTLGSVVTSGVAGGTVNSSGVLSFGYKGGCPAEDDLPEKVLLAGNTTVDGQPVAQEYSLFVQRLASTLSTTLPSGVSSAFSGETVEGILFRLVRSGSAIVTAAPITVQAVLNGLPVGQFIEPVSGEFGNPLTLPAPSDGRLLLDYETEAGLRSDQTVTLTAGASDDTLCINARAANKSLRVRSKGTGSLVLAGDGGEPSGTIALTPGDIGSFVVRALDGLGNAAPGTVVSLSSAPSNVGRIVIPSNPGASSAITGADGSITADFYAPATIAANQTVTITAQATVDGRALSSTYSILLTPSAPEAAPVLSLSGPASAAPGAETTGYLAKLVRVDGTAVQGTVLSFSATNGSVTVYEGGTARPGVSSLQTDATGTVAFSLTPSSALTADTTAVITATVASGQPLSGECSGTADAVCTASRNVSVPQDSFEFTAPSFGTSVLVGNPNAQTLSFSWQTALGSPVAECLDLTASFRGAGDASYGLIIGDDTTPQTQIRRVQLNASGEFATAIKVYSDRSGFLEIAARENRGCTATASGPLTASAGVQFVDEVCGTTADGRNCVDLGAPIRTLTSPDAGGAQRSAALTLSVLNNAYQPIDGAQVSFAITSPASCAGALNERVFPGGGTTNANGVASSQYFVPNFSPQLANGTTCQVQVQGCVRGQSGSDPDAVFCSTRTIIIEQPTP
ncbi:MAG: hypothetical protein Q8Q73_03750 [Stagnimonas sp.]|nr:hypothetical protein [Stagnimonas sp.]